MNDRVRIFLVDDSPHFREAATDFLQMQPAFAVVGSATNGEDAVDQARRLAPTVILLDLNLDGASGLDYIPRLRQHLPCVKIIALSMMDESAYRAAVLSAGADAFVHKAAMTHKLVTVIEEVTGISVQPVAPAARVVLHAGMDSAFVQLIEHASDLIFRYEFLPQRGFSYVNSAANALTGYTPDEYYADPDLGVKLIHPDDRPLFERVVREGRVLDAPLALRWVRKDGSTLWVEQRHVVFYDDAGRMIAVEGSARDITQRKQEELRLLNQANLLDHVGAAIVSFDTAMRLKSWNRGAERIYGWQAEQAIGQSDETLFQTRYAGDMTRARVIQRLNEQSEFIAEVRQVRRDGVWITVEMRAVTVRDENGAVAGYVTVNQDITARKLQEERQRLQSAALEHAANGVVITDPEGRIEWVNPAFTGLTGYTLAESQGKNPRELVRSGLHDDAFYKTLWDTISSGTVWRGVTINRRKDSTLYFEEQTIAPVRDPNGRVAHYVAIKQDITARKQHELELETIANVGMALRNATTRATIIPVILDQLIELLNVDGVALETLNPLDDEMRIEQAQGVWETLTGQTMPAGIGLEMAALAEGRSYLQALANKQTAQSAIFAECNSIAGVPLAVSQQTLGMLWVGAQRALNEHEIRLLGMVGDIAAATLSRAQLHEQTERRLARLTALRAIDHAIATSLDLQLTLNVIVEQTVAQLNVDAAAVLLYQPHTLSLEYAAGRGFYSRDIERTRLRLGQGRAGRAALERRTLIFPDVAPEPASVAEMLQQHDAFVSHHVTPLLVKGQVRGVLETYHRTRLEPTPEWIAFFETLAQQTAIAIDNAQLFADLQRSNIELSLAYDATIEGWSRALDLRDKETEGHTQRVTEMTERLARAIGIGDAEIVHVRRGALLHDIGKMGIPDQILLKPGPLNAEEWDIMRQHPKLAYDLLSPILYLHPALDIPYCHHEKWDGTGYPRGLKGDAIPLAARIFAIVDVWDALSSDRPYRKAWSPERVIEHIRSLAGTHFDPALVGLFFRVIQERDDVLQVRSVF